MAETTPAPARSAPKPTADPSPTPGTALQAGQGTTKIADEVVSKVAGIAAREVAGVYGLGGTTTRAIGNVTSRVGISESRSQGVAVEVNDHDAKVDVTIVVDYGESIPTVTQEIRARIIKRVEGICGLTVTEVNITVNDLHFDGDDDDNDEQA